MAGRRINIKAKAKEVQDSLNQIDSSVSKLGKDANNVITPVNNAASSVDKLTESVSKFSKKNKFSLDVKITTSKETLGDSVQPLKELNNEIKSAEKIVNDSADALKRLENAKSKFKPKKTNTLPVEISTIESPINSLKNQVSKITEVEEPFKQLEKDLSKLPRIQESINSFSEKINKGMPQVQNVKISLPAYIQELFNAFKNVDVQAGLSNLNVISDTLSKYSKSISKLSIPNASMGSGGGVERTAQTVYNLLDGFRGMDVQTGLNNMDVVSNVLAKYTGVLKSLVKIGTIDSKQIITTFENLSVALKSLSESKTITEMSQGNTDRFGAIGRVLKNLSSFINSVVKGGDFSGFTTNIERAIPAITEFINKMSGLVNLSSFPDFERVARAVGSFNGRLKEVNSTVEHSSRSFIRLRSILRQIYTAFVGGAVIYSIVRSIKSAVKEMFNLEYAMARVNTIARVSSGELKTMTHFVQEVSASYGIASEKVSKALYDINSATIKGVSSLKILEQSAKLAVAGFTDIDKVTNLIARAVNAYEYSASEAAKISDILFVTVERGINPMEELSEYMGRLFTVAANAGVSLEEVGAGLATLTARGYQTNVASTALNSAILKLSTGTKELNKLFNQYGYASSASALRTLGLSGALEILYKTTNGATEKLHDLGFNYRDIRAATTLASGAISEYNKTLALMNDETYKNGLTNEALAKAQDTVIFKFNQLKQSYTVFIQSISEYLNRNEDIKKFLDMLSDGFSSLTKAMHGMNLSFKEQASSGLITLIPKLLLTYALLKPISKGIDGILVGSYALKDSFIRIVSPVKNLNDEVIVSSKAASSASFGFDSISKGLSNVTAPVINTTHAFKNLASELSVIPQVATKTNIAMNTLAKVSSGKSLSAFALPVADKSITENIKNRIANVGERMRDSKGHFIPKTYSFAQFISPKLKGYTQASGYPEVGIYGGISHKEITLANDKLINQFSSMKTIVGDTSLKVQELTTKLSVMPKVVPGLTLTGIGSDISTYKTLGTSPSNPVDILTSTSNLASKLTPVSELTNNAKISLNGMSNSISNVSVNMDSATSVVSKFTDSITLVPKIAQDATVKLNGFYRSLSGFSVNTSSLSKVASSLGIHPDLIRGKLDTTISSNMILPTMNPKDFSSLSVVKDKGLLGRPSLRFRANLASPYDSLFSRNAYSFDADSVDSQLRDWEMARTNFKKAISSKINVSSLLKPQSVRIENDPISLLSETKRFNGSNLAKELNFVANAAKNTQISFNGMTKSIEGVSLKSSTATDSFKVISSVAKTTASSLNDVASGYVFAGNSAENASKSLTKSQVALRAFATTAKSAIASFGMMALQMAMVNAFISTLNDIRVVSSAGDLGDNVYDLQGIFSGLAGAVGKFIDFLTFNTTDLGEKFSMAIKAPDYVDEKALGESRVHVGDENKSGFGQAVSAQISTLKKFDALANGLDEDKILKAYNSAIDEIQKEARSRKVSKDQLEVALKVASEQRDLLLSYNDTIKKLLPNTQALSDVFKQASKNIEESVDKFASPMEKQIREMIEAQNAITKIAKITGWSEEQIKAGGVSVSGFNQLEEIWKEQQGRSQIELSNLIAPSIGSVLNPSSYTKMRTNAEKDAFSRYSEFATLMKNKTGLDIGYNYKGAISKYSDEMLDTVRHFMENPEYSNDKSISKSAHEFSLAWNELNKIKKMPDFEKYSMGIDTFISDISRLFTPEQLGLIEQHKEDLLNAFVKIPDKDKNDPDIISKKLMDIIADPELAKQLDVLGKTYLSSIHNAEQFRKSILKVGLDLSKLGTELSPEGIIGNKFNLQSVREIKERLKNTVYDPKTILGADLGVVDQYANIAMKGILGHNPVNVIVDSLVTEFKKNDALKDLDTNELQNRAISFIGAIQQIGSYTKDFVKQLSEMDYTKAMNKMRFGSELSSFKKFKLFGKDMLSSLLGMDITGAGGATFGELLREFEADTKASDFDTARDNMIKKFGDAGETVWSAFAELFKDLIGYENEFISPLNTEFRNLKKRGKDFVKNYRDSLLSPIEQFQKTEALLNRQLANIKAQAKKGEIKPESIKNAQDTIEKLYKLNEETMNLKVPASITASEFVRSGSKEAFDLVARNVFKDTYKVNVRQEKLQEKLVKASEKLVTLATQGSKEVSQSVTYP